ncbi:MAG TPA: serine/threonine-protein kinase [Gemmatimonadaceae bacterium]|nr:serine/threonine-protein kinase [Gemmatimonadaceae bacterium]
MFCIRCGLNVTVEYAAPGANEDPAVSDTMQRLRAAIGDRYDVQRELGRGGMATVFLARDIKHEREVAIKVLHPELAASLGGDRFEREIRLAAKLQHPHILGLYDSGASGSLLYYVMPFVQGESLRDRLNREGMLPVEDATRIALEVADALGYAHAQGIIHRDIKPENILLQGGHALVADFGIARAVGEAGSGGAKLTQTGMSVGTPVYMAPEQAAGDVANPTADIYSLGCVLYEMLAGEPPFTGPNPMAIMAKHLMEQVPSVRIVRSAVPEEIENAIFAALGKLPVDRPQTAAQFTELMGMPLGSTATMRVMRGSTAMRRTMSGNQATIPAPLPPPPFWQRAAVYVAGVLVLAIAGSAYVFWPRGARGLGESPNARRVAVLYFEDRSRDSSLSALADGLTDGLIHALGNSTSLTVISRAGAAQYRGSKLGVDSIASLLRAGYIVRGEVEPEGTNVRVAVRLDDASGATLRRESFSVPSGEELQMRDTLTARVSDLIRSELGAEIQVREDRAGASNARAWLLVQRGAQATRMLDSKIAASDSAAVEAAYQSADSLFVAASGVDPKWAEPYVRRSGNAYRRSRSAGRDPANIRPWVELAIVYADSAITLDENDSDAFEARGTARYWGWLSNLDSEAAKQRVALMASKSDFDRATALNTRQAGAWASLSHLYYQLDSTNVNDVYIAAQRALEADEFLSNANVVLYRLFLAAYDLGQFDRASQECANFGRRFPKDVRYMRCRLFLLNIPRAGAADVATAWKLADSLVTVASSATKDYERLSADMLVAATLARASKATAPSDPTLADSARHVARRSEGSAQIDATRELAFRGAYVYTILGDTRDAMRLLTAYVAANQQRTVSLRNDPGWWFGDIAHTPAWERLVGRQR